MEEKGKIQNGKEILNQIKEIKDHYESELADIKEEEMSFLDKFNNLAKLILNDESFSVYTALSQESVDEWKKSRFKRWIKNHILGNLKNFLYFVLLASITGFLVMEAVTFYMEGDIPTFKTYVKAILTEACFIFLSGYRTSGLWNNVWVNTLRASIFALMLFVISSQTIYLGTKTTSESSKIQEQIVLIEKQIADKEKDIEYYKNKDWPSTTRQLIKEKNALVDKLIVLKDEQAKGKNEEVSDIDRYKTYGKAFFRVLLLFISILITRRIFSF